MKRAILIFLFFASWILFQFQGCTKETIMVETEYDTIAVVETVYVDTATFVDTTELFVTYKYSYLLNGSWLYFGVAVYYYTNNNNVYFVFEQTSLIDTASEELFYQNHNDTTSGNGDWSVGAFNLNIGSNYQIGDTLFALIDYKIIEFEGVTDSSIVYRIRELNILTEILVLD